MGTAIQKQVRQFSATYLIKTVSDCFEKIADHRPTQQPPAKAGGLVLRTGSPDTRQRRVMIQS